MRDDPTSELRERILAAARGEPSATRRDAARQTASIIAAAMAADLAAFWLLGGLRFCARPLRFVLITQGGSALVALMALFGAFGRGRSMLGRSRRLLLTVTVMTPLALSTWLLAWAAACPEVLIGAPARIGLRCLVFSLAVAAWPLALIIRSRRETNPVAPIAAGAARGTAVGGLAWVLVGLWCPLANPAHLAVGHVLPLLLLAALGGWLGKRLTGVRYDLHTN